MYILILAAPSFLGLAFLGCMIAFVVFLARPKWKKQNG